MKRVIMFAIALSLFVSIAIYFFNVSMTERLPSKSIQVPLLIIGIISGIYAFYVKFFTDTSK